VRPARRRAGWPPAGLVLPALLFVVGCGGSGAAAPPDAGADAAARDAGEAPGDATAEAAPVFGQDSPRPACQYVADPGRTPYALPQVVAAGWSEPVKLPTLNTPCPEDAIEISRDGTTLYFYWSPTVGASFDELLNGTTGTYYARRVGTDPGTFADPRFFDLRQGAAGGACDGEPSFSPTGDRVYFHSTRAANTGYLQQPPVDDPMDIYVATVTDGVPGPAANLGEPINSPSLDGEHCLSPDGTRLYLTSTRPGGLGAGDLWVATRSGDGWTTPVNLGAPINSTSQELQPAFAADDPSTMYFVSDRDGPTGIYRSTYTDAWSQPELVVTGFVGEPTLVADGSLLYFVHVLVDDQGVFGSDIWYLARE
jgi:hypothetical protein